MTTARRLLLIIGRGIGAAVANLLKEDGGNLLLEDGTSVFILE